MLHGGELLKIRGLCRNKQAPTASTMSETSSLHYASTETGCDKSMYDQHSDRMVSTAIIKESPVIVTSPQLGNAVTTHKPSLSSSSSSSSSIAASGSNLCTNDQDISKRVQF